MAQGLNGKQVRRVVIDTVIPALPPQRSADRKFSSQRLIDEAGSHCASAWEGEGFCPVAHCKKKQCAAGRSASPDTGLGHRLRQTGACGDAGQGEIT